MDLTLMAFDRPGFEQSFMTNHSGKGRSRDSLAQVSFDRIHL